MPPDIVFYGIISCITRFRASQYPPLLDSVRELSLLVLTLVYFRINVT